MKQLSITGRTGLIIARNSFATQQTTEWLQQLGYQCIQTEPNDAIHHPQLKQASILIVDVSSGNSSGLKALHCTDASALRIVLCRGGNSPAMRRARSIGVDGFLYIKDRYDSIDFQRGLAANSTLMMPVKSRQETMNLPTPTPPAAPCRIYAH
ncbi:MAG: hypothetical protein R8K50_06665 [Mariprofundus sp.]